MTEQEQRQLIEDIEARGWPAKPGEYEGSRVVKVRDQGPGFFICKSRYEAECQGFVLAPDHHIKANRYW
jgi:hypothetical protein